MILSAPANAKVNEADIISQLEGSGYTLVEREVSWLGRVVLEFHSQTHEREIILNPTTGEIIRDYLEVLDGEDENETWFEKLFETETGKDD